MVGLPDQWIPFIQATVQVSVSYPRRLVLDCCEATSDFPITSSSMHCSASRIFNIPAIMLASLITFFSSGAETAPCASSTVALHVATTYDVQTVMDELKCTGPGSFNITWHSSLEIDQRIDVTSQKSITITGSGSPIIRAAPVDNNNAESTANTGLFHVSNGSILLLSHLTLEAGNTSAGGAVSVWSSSFLFVFGCTFISNHASEFGGETTTVGDRRLC